MRIGSSSSQVLASLLQALGTAVATSIITLNSWLPGEGPGLLLGADESVERIQLVAARMQGAYITNHLPITAIAFESNSSYSATNAKRWLIAAIDGGDLKIVEVEITCRHGYSRIYVVSARFKTASAGPLTSESVNHAFPLMNLQRVALNKRSAGYGVPWLQYYRKSPEAQQENMELWSKTYDRFAGTCAKGPGLTLLTRARGLLATLPDGGRPDVTARKLLLSALRTCPHEAPVVDEVGEGLRLLGEPFAAMTLYTCASSWGLWRHPLQRILEAFKPWLPSAAFLGPEVFGDLPELQWTLEIVQSFWTSIRTDFSRSRKRLKAFSRLQHCTTRGSGCWVRAISPELKRWTSGTWSAYYVAELHEGIGYVCNIVHFPSFCTALAQVRSLGVKVVGAGISVVHGPSTHIPIHRSFQQERLRLMCGLWIPANSSSILRFPGFIEKAFELGKCWWHDESFEHELLHYGGDRWAMSVDIIHPAVDGRVLHGNWVRSRLSGSLADVSKESKASDVEACLGIHTHE